MRTYVDDAIERIEWVLREVLPAVNMEPGELPTAAAASPWRHTPSGEDPPTP